MENPVLEINGEIEDEKRDNEFNPRWPGELMKQSPLARFSKQRKANRAGRRGNARNKGIEENHSEISRPASPAGNRPVPSGAGSFPGRHQEQDAEKTAEANEGFFA